jgi:hypothetical protein
MLKDGEIIKYETIYSSLKLSEELIDECVEIIIDSDFYNPETFNDEEFNDFLCDYVRYVDVDEWCVSDDSVELNINLEKSDMKSFNQIIRGEKLKRILLKTT